MPSAREIRQQLLQAESARLKAREEAILAVIGATNQWKRSVARATQAERTLHALTAAALEHVSAEELAEFGGLPAKDVKSWARNGAGKPAEKARTATRGKAGVKAASGAARQARSAAKEIADSAAIARPPVAVELPD